MSATRVAVFVDGKNFYRGLKASGLNPRVDFAQLARRLVDAAGGAMLTGMHYYTGVDEREADFGGEEGRSGLEGFLTYLESQPGCFVHRFARRQRASTCPACGHSDLHYEDGAVDTSLVADMVWQAAAGVYDAAVLCSGDPNYAPALEALRRMGKPAWVATFGTPGAAKRLRQVAYGHIDLAQVIGERAPATSDEREETPLAPDAVAAVREAEAYFGADRYVGLNLLINGWRTRWLPRDPAERSRCIQEAIDTGKLEVYDAPDGCKAVRVRESRP